MDAVILDALPAHVAVLDAEGVIVSVNAAWRQFGADNALQGIGYFVGRNYLQVCETATGEGAEEARAAAQGIRRVLRGETPEFSLEYPCHAPTQQRWFRLTVTPFGREGTARGAVVMHLNITERRRNEEALRKITATATMASRLARIGAWSAELPDLTLTMSDEVLVIHELPPGTVLSKEEAIGFYAPEARATITRAFEAAMREGKPYDLELPMITARGRPIWVRTMGEVERDATGTICRIQGVFQDITDRKANEAAQRELAERLSTTLESLTDGFFTLDRSWRFTYANREAERMLHRPRAELLGRSVWDLFPEAVGSVAQVQYEKAMREGVPTQYEYFFEPLATWFDGRVFPSPQGLAVYLRDITAVHQADDALRVSEERFRLLAKATNDAVWDWDLASHSLWWNEGFETLFGYNRHEVAPTIESWTHCVHPDDRERVLNGIQRTIDEGAETWSDEYRFLRKDGSYAYVIDRGHVIRDTSGKAARMIGGVTDLTERREAERRLAEQADLLDKARDAIIVRDLGHRISFWNQGAVRLYGWTKAEAVGRSARNLLYMDPAPFDEAMVKVLADGEWIGELAQTRKDGTAVSIEGRWTLVRDKEGRPKSILAINTDISERKKLEQQFLRAQRLESVGTLAGGIAHDLNNLLAPILMGVELLRQFEPSPRSKPIIDTLERSARRGAGLVRQVLSFSRGVEGARVMLRLERIVEEVQAIVENTFPKDICFERRLAPDLWPLVGDATQLNQVLLNLCVNARDAMPEGGSLTIAAANADVDDTNAGLHPGVSPGRYVLLQVIDTGTGIPPEVIDRIFEPFFTTKEIGKGTGLGLATVLGIVRSHGGGVNVTSEIGAGSTFHIHLPAQPGETATPTIAPAEDRLPRGHDELILVVDDEVSVREVTRQTLQTFGYRVLTAVDGAHAVALYATHRGEIALVLTDMMMPVMDGAVLMSALRRMDPGVRIIASSGLNNSGMISRAANFGVKHFLLKPYSTEALLILLKQVLADTR